MAELPRIMWVSVEPSSLDTRRLIAIKSSEGSDAMSHFGVMVKLWLAERG